MHQITDAIAQSEIGHSGQIQFVVETSLSPQALFAGLTPRQRSLELFSLQRVWDTERNNGVLIYLLMADRAFEIVADRGIHQNVGDQFWQLVCQQMADYLKKGDFIGGVECGIHEIDRVLRQHYAADVITPNELPDHPTII